MFALIILIESPITYFYHKRLKPQYILLLRVRNNMDNTVMSKLILIFHLWV